MQMFQFTWRRLKNLAWKTWSRPRAILSQCEIFWVNMCEMTSFHVLRFTKVFQLQGRNTSHMNSDDDVSTRTESFHLTFGEWIWTFRIRFNPPQLYIFMSKFNFSWRYTALVTWQSCWTPTLKLSKLTGRRCCSHSWASKSTITSKWFCKMKI